MIRGTPFLRPVALLLAWVAMGAAGSAASPPKDPAKATVIETQTKAVVRALEAAIILSGQEGGAIRLAVWNGLFMESGRSGRSVLVVEVDGPAVLEGSAGDQLELDLYLYALRGDQDVESSISRHVRVDLGRHRSLIESGGLKLLVSIELSPGDHMLRLLVRTGAQDFGVRSFPVSVPETAGDGIGSRPPVFPDQTRSWLIAVPALEGGAAEASLLPFVIGDGMLVPAALPIVHSGETMRGMIFLPTSTPSPDRAEATLRPDFGEGVVKMPLELLNRQTSQLQGWQTVDFELPPMNLPRGFYTAVVHLESDGLTSRDTASFNMVVAADSDAVVWPQLPLETTDQPPGQQIVAGVPDGKPSEARRQDLADTEIVDRYREVLGQLAKGETEHAHLALQALERQTSLSSAGTGLQRLEDSQNRVLRALSQQPPCLFPVMLLHAQSARRYRQLEWSILAGHALRMVQSLADVYVEQANHTVARRDAADLLAELAAGEGRNGNLATAILLDDAALALDPKNTRALFCMASLRERQGHYRAASDLLEQLLVLEPDHAEARLRMGLNFVRQSRTKRARAQLNSLTMGGVEPWIALLAYQELARLELDRNRPAQALEILRSGLDAWPDDFTLNLQYAFALDTLQRPAEAFEILRDLDQAGTDSTGSSARWNYQQPPNWGRIQGLQALAERASAWLPDLQQALEESSSMIARR